MWTVATMWQQQWIFQYEILQKRTSLLLSQHTKPISQETVQSMDKFRYKSFFIKLTFQFYYYHNKL